MADLKPLFISDTVDPSPAHVAMDDKEPVQLEEGQRLSSPDPSLRDQQTAGDAVTVPAGKGDTKSMPIRSCSPDVLLQESLDEMNAFIGEGLEDMATSTPFTQKCIESLKPNDDPFQTPSNTDTSDRSFTTPSTTQTSSSSFEILLGPQPRPFIRNRHPLTGESYEPPRLRFRGEALLPPATVPIKVAAPTPQPAPLSKWRKEQLKKTKVIRPIATARERPIPLLHGPLSLPYARNPSGVDATVADQTNYLSNVFGLRMAPSPTDQRRTASGSTDARTVSSSSYLTTGSSNSSRPAVVRDYHQMIGIKKDDHTNPFENINTKMANLRTLGLGKPASKFKDNSIHSASAQPWRTPSDGLATDFKMLTLIDPTTNNVYTARVPKSETDRVVSAELLAPGQGSKADASVNWRSNMAALREAGSPVVPPPPPSNTPRRPVVEEPVLTIEHLHEKFGTKKNVEFAPKAVVRAPPKSTEATTLNDTTARHINVTNSPSKERRKKLKNRKEQTRSKGTPGAGKHLIKRSPDATDDPKDAPVELDTPRKARSNAPSPTPNRVKSSKSIQV